MSPAKPIPDPIVKPMSSGAELIGIAAILMATISLSIDIMLPARGTIASDLGASDANQRQRPTCGNGSSRRCSSGWPLASLSSALCPISLAAGVPI